MRPTLRYVTPLLVLAAVACDGSSPAETDPSNLPTQLVVVSGDDQAGPPGMELPQPLTVRVLDEANQPVANQLVNFVVTDGGGSLFAGASLTDANGIARDRWTLGPVMGALQEVQARAVDNQTGAPLLFGTFSAVTVPGSPDSILALTTWGPASPGETLWPDAAVLVLDQGGHPVPGVTVSWAASGDGLAQPLESVTDQSGVATTAWTLGAQNGTQTLTATVGGLSTELFAVTGSSTGSFDGGAFGQFTWYSEGGSGWKLENGQLVGFGFAIQNVLILDGQSATDGWVEATLSSADDGGLVMRFEDADNYVLLAIRDDSAPSQFDGQNLKLYLRDDGAFPTLWSTDLTWPRGSERVVRLELAGSTARIYVDGALLAEVPGIPVADGRFGLRHYGDDSGWEVRYDAFDYGS